MSCWHGLCANSACSGWPGWGAGGEDSALPWLLAIFLALGELRGGVAPGAGAPFWLEDSGVSNRRKSVLREHGWQGTAGPHWEGDCEDEGEVGGWLFGTGAKGNGAGSDSGSGAWAGRRQDRLGMWFCSFLVPQWSVLTKNVLKALK